MTHSEKHLIYFLSYAESWPFEHSLYNMKNLLFLAISCVYKKYENIVR